MSYLFGRAYALNLTGAASDAYATQEGPVSPDLRVSVTLDGTSQPDLRVSFELKSDTTGKANKGKVTLYNLAPSTIAILAKGSEVRLQAGYINNIGLVFAGTVEKVATKKDGPEIVTELEVGDGEQLLTYGNTHHSYRTAVSLQQIVTDIAKDMRVSLASQSIATLTGVKARKKLQSTQFARGYVTSGSCAYELNRLLPPLQLQWFVRNGALYIVSVNEPVTLQAVVLSAETGLLGVPSRNENAVLTAQCLVNPNIAIGGYVQIVSQNAAQSGFFKVNKLDLTGDTHGDAWTMDIEADPV